MNQEQLEDRRTADPPFWDRLSPVTEAHTYIDLSDDRGFDSERPWAPSEWKRLELFNRGIHNGKWENPELKRGQDKWYLCQNISSQLAISGGLRERLCNIYKDLDLRSFKKYETHSNLEDTEPWDRWDIEYPVIHSTRPGDRKKYLVIFCIGALLHNQNKHTDHPGYYPGMECESRPRYGVQCRSVSTLVETELRDRHELLYQFADRLGFRDEDIRSCMEKLRSKCPRLRDNGE